MVMKLQLRTVSVPQAGTFGVLYLNGEKFAVSCEPEWHNNEKSISCIPAGTYALSWHQSGRYGRVIALSNRNLGVSIRDNTQRNFVYFHSGNYPQDTQGCILLGERFAEKWGVASSRKATSRFYELIENNPSLELEIIREQI